MIGNKTRCIFSQRVPDNAVIDHSFPGLQFPNTNDSFRQHRNPPSLFMDVVALVLSELRISEWSRLNDRTQVSDQPRPISIYSFRRSQTWRMLPLPDFEANSLGR